MTEQIEAAVAAERERCARIADWWADPSKESTRHIYGDRALWAAKMIANSIRSPPAADPVAVFAIRHGYD